MTRELWTPEELRAVRLDSIQDWFRRSGWVAAPSPRPTSTQYTSTTMHDDDGAPVALYFPNAEHYVDYPLRVFDLISALSVLYNTSPQQIFNELAIAPRPAPVSR